MGPLTQKIMLKALGRLDELLTTKVTLIIGGGGAMILAHRYPMGTMDIDAVPKGIEMKHLDVLVKQIATELELPPDWLNPYFSSFAHTLPSDYGTRLVEVYSGAHLSAQALSIQEMLIMKCFAHRQKDVPHAKALIKAGADIDAVENQIEMLSKKGIPGTTEAADFLQDVLDQLDGSE
jgi:hypothetical protein